MFEVALQVRVDAKANLNSADQTCFIAELTYCGIFTVNVSVTTPNGFPIADKRIEIRSTEFNEVALGITLGALAFLILFYVTRVVRRHRHGEDQSSGALA